MQSVMLCFRLGPRGLRSCGMLEGMEPSWYDLVACWNLQFYSSVSYLVLSLGQLKTALTM